MREYALQLHFAEAAVSPVEVTVYSLDGVMVATQTLGSGVSEGRCRLSGLPSGVYAVQLNSSDRRVRGSSLIRL